MKKILPVINKKEHSRAKHAGVQGGQAMLIATMLFLAASTTMVFGFSQPAINQLKIEANLKQGGQSYYASEALLEDITYRIKNNIPVSATENLTIGSNTASATVTDSGDKKTIVSTGDSNNRIRKIQTDLKVGQGAAFNYGIEVGNGGVDLSGGSRVIGNIYANGPITGHSGEITGNAVSALSAPPTPQFVNATPLPQTNEINFGNSNDAQDLAQSFTASDSSTISKISVYIRKTNSPSNLTIRIVTDDNGVPSKTTLASATLAAYTIGSSYGWFDVPFSSPASIVSGERYWIILDGSTNSCSQYYCSEYSVATNDAMSGEGIKLGQYRKTNWSDTTSTGQDAYIQIYTGGIPSEITGTGNYVGALKINGNAWANNISNASVLGDMWCNVETTTDNSCDTTHGDPPEEQFPVSDSNINSWKDEAAAGTVFNGSKAINYAGATLGPMKITGNVTINGGGTLVVSGTLWIEGDFKVSGGAKVKLAPGYGDTMGVIVVDGLTNLSGGGAFSGSGVSGSYPLIVSTSSCPNADSCSGKPAITLTGGAGAIVLVAQNGTVDIDGGTSVKSVVGYRTEISGGGSVIYDSGLANPNFNSGPSGGFSIIDWKEVK